MGLKFITVPVLARILAPEEFGVIAASIVVVLFVAMIGGMGLPSALVAEKRDEPRLWNLVFTFVFLIGVLLALGLARSADTVGRWLGAGDTIAVLSVLAWLIPLQVLGDVSEAMLTKRLQFDRMAVWQVLADAVAAAAAIAAALAGWGVWSLVVQQFLSSLVRVGGNLYAANFLPRLAWSLRDIRHLGHFGSRVMVADLLLYLCIQGPVAIVTRMLGTQATGFFSVPNRFVELPNQIILSSLATVLFPSFAAMADQPVRLSRALLRSSQLTTALQAPVMFGLAVVAEPIMDLLFGEQWLEAWPVFAVLALAKGVMAPCGSFGAFLKGIGRADVLWKLTAVRTVLVLALCIVGAQWEGLLGLVLGILVANLLFMVMFGAVVFEVSGVGVRVGLLRVFSILFQAFLMAAVARELLLLMQSVGYNSIWLLVVVAVTGGSLYIAMAWFFQPTTRETVLQLIDGKKRVGDE